MTDYSAYVPPRNAPADLAAAPQAAEDLSGSAPASEAFGAMLTGADAPYPNWRVPVELVYALASPAMQAVIRSRRGQGVRPKTDAVVWVQTEEFYAIVQFEGPDRPGLLFRLSCWPWGAR